MFESIVVEPSKMSTRGQIVIPQDIRKKMGLGRDELFMVGSVDKNTILLKKVDKKGIAKEFMKIRKGLIKRSGGLSKAEIEAEINAVRKKS